MVRAQLRVGVRLVLLCCVYDALSLDGGPSRGALTRPLVCCPVTVGGADGSAVVSTGCVSPAFRRGGRTRSCVGKRFGCGVRSAASVIGWPPFSCGSSLTRLDVVRGLGPLWFPSGGRLSDRTLSVARGSGVVGDSTAVGDDRGCSAPCV